MTPSLPRIDDEVETWRAFAIAHASDARVRRAVLAATDSMRDDDAIEVLTALVPYVRGQGRVDVIDRIAASAPRRAPRGSLVYVLTGELLASSGATRSSCVEALLAAHPDERDGFVLAVALASRIPGLREVNERERAAWDVVLARGIHDPFKGLEPHDVLHACRRGGEGLGDRAVALDHALVLCTAGAPRATVTHLRTLAQHVMVNREGATPAAARVLTWLARASSRTGSAPASVRDAGWFTTAVDALSRTAFAVSTPGYALGHAAERLAGDAFDRAVAHAIVARAVVDARRAHGAAATALADTLDTVLGALVASSRIVEPHARQFIATLLGRDPNGAYVGAGRWLTDDLRARIVETALLHADLAARDLALTDLERNGAIALLAPILRDVAASDPDPVVRQHARQLARGERL